MAHDHVSGRRNYVREINAVVTLAAMDRLLLHGLLNEDRTAQPERDEVTVTECLPR